ncbi:hypothetical protein Ddye_019681 [Dipteronia dyeriana]|uniref:Uncharacterized protein n=1 Tax=Dipteronia dyeriana TaxID=168575 RepID=A0AAD9TYF5_9ROSI|nr:hypothetical protein Ddye_019681 [Dipteronia dyeriana]
MIKEVLIPSIYRRTDEDAEREELFLPHLTNPDTQVSPNFQQLTEKTASTKSKSFYPQDEKAVERIMLHRRWLIVTMTALLAVLSQKKHWQAAGDTAQQLDICNFCK